jgi:hypothetical protein
MSPRPLTNFELLFGALPSLKHHVYNYLLVVGTVYEDW